MLEGTSNPDSLVGAEDDDTLDGAAGKDTLTGGAGADVFRISNDTDSTSTATDYIKDFNPSEDVIDLRTLSYAAITENTKTATGELRILYSASSNRTYLKSDQTGFMIGMNGDHRSDLNSSNILLHAAPNLLLEGTAGADSLVGGAGNDTLDGAEGKDTLTGGAGADVYRVSSNTHSTSTATDYIKDFQPSQDVIDLRGLGYGILTSNTSTLVGELRILYSTNSNRTYLKSDQTGFMIGINGDHRSNLNASNVLLVNPNHAPVLVTAPGDLQATENADFSVTFDEAAFSDADGDTLQWSVTQGDGSTLPAWLAFNAETRTLSGIAPEGSAGDLNLIVQVDDGNGGTASTSLLLTTLVSVITNHAPVLVTAPGDLQATENAAFSATFDAAAFSDADGDTLQWSVALGDGSALPAWLAFNAETRTLSGIAPEGSAGDLNLIVQVDDGNGGTASAGTSIHIEPPGILLMGTIGKDTLIGGGGNDTLEGAAGKDTLTGNMGADVFRYTQKSDSPNTGRDLITDFQDGVDVIDLRGLGYVGIVSTPSSNEGQIRITYTPSSNTTYLKDDFYPFQVALNGDHRAALADNTHVLIDSYLLDAQPVGQVFLLPVLGQSNARGLSEVGEDTESGISHLENSLSELLGGMPVQSRPRDESGTYLDVAVGGSMVTGSSTASQEDLDKSWWYSDTDQPGNALLRAASLLMEHLVKFEGHWDQAAGLPIIWIQGETEANDITFASDKEALTAEYKENTLKVFNYLEEHLGVSLEVYIEQIGRYQEEAGLNRGYNENAVYAFQDGTDRVRAAQTELTQEHGNIHLAGDYRDLAMFYETDPVGHADDVWHLDNDSYEVVGDRLAEFVALEKGYTHVLHNPGMFPRAGLQDLTLQTAQAYTVTGAAGHDVLVGGALSDSMAGADGNDTFYGGAGADSLTGDSGNDVFYYQYGDSAPVQPDLITDFAQGEDTLDVANLGFTAVQQGTATGTMLGFVLEEGSTRIFDSGGSFELRLAGEMDLQAADFGNFIQNAPVIYDNNGILTDQVIVGTTDAETLFGGLGNDQIDGAGGKDMLIGRTGADTFRFSSRTESIENNADVITDFETGVDKVDISGLGYSNITLDTAIEGQLRLLYSSISDRTYVRDDFSDFEFSILGDRRAEISADDFIF